MISNFPIILDDLKTLIELKNVKALREIFDEYNIVDLTATGGRVGILMKRCLFLKR